jgi:hypothetical protein
MGTKTKKSRYNKRGGKRVKNKTKKRKHNTPLQKTQPYKQTDFKKLNCIPENQHKEYTCYSDSDLDKLKEMWNIRHPDQPINTTDPKKIWQQLKEYYASVCNKETCWVRQMTKNTKMEKELLDAFAPESPEEWNKNPNEWLSSVDIDKVMKQYEKAYKCFDFIGPSPIDFDKKLSYGECVWNELCNFSLANQIKKGKNKIGIIFNTDPHNKSGAHWISLFINIKKKKIFFFDSVGTKVSSEIMKLVNRIIDQGHKLNPKIIFKFDDSDGVEHQYKNTECGIYSLFFIIHMLQDKTSEDFYKTHIIKDDQIQNYRKIYFNEEL